MSEDVPELEVLSHYIGTWEVVATSNKEPAATGRHTTKWVLDGRFIQSTGFVKMAEGSNDFELASLATYDQIKKTYRRWSFMSNGHTEESEGTWNAKTRTMTFITRYGDITQTSRSKFAEEGVERWTIVNADQSNNVVSEMHGTNKRSEE